MTSKRASQLCIYCGGKVRGVRKGEHIIPEAIGGGRAIKTVCGACNNEFSKIDTELCSRSPLSVVASQEIDAHIWQVWDVDHMAKNLLLEARPDWSAKSLAQYPQIVFEPSGPQIRGDYEEMLHFGRESFEKVLVKTMLRAFRHHEAGEKRWLHLERVEANPALSRGYRLPPRIFARRSICELAERLVRNERASFVLRYLSRAEKRFALNALDGWSPACSFERFNVRIGSYLPALRLFCDATKTFRALAKIGINILSEYCPNTPVNRDADGFRDMIRVVKGEASVTPQAFRANGFVYATDIEPIKADDGGHSFRLVHMDEHWHIFSAFFGGRIGSFLRFRAPNHETWFQADIHAPLRSGKWTATTGKILQPLTVRIEWQNPARIMPSVEMLNVESELKVTRAVGSL
ncbi:HNH endonuclease [Planctomycetota bacterium]